MSNLTISESRAAAKLRCRSAKHPYPCIRAFHFVNLFMAKNSIYPDVVLAGRGGDRLFLDLGCQSMSAKAL